MISTVSTEDHSRCTLKLIDELFAAACQKAVAVVQPRDNKTVHEFNWCTASKCTSTALNATQRTVAASGQLINVRRERQIRLEQHAEITKAGWRLNSCAGRWKWCIRWWFLCRTPQDISLCRIHRQTYLELQCTWFVNSVWNNTARRCK